MNIMTNQAPALVVKALSASILIAFGANAQFDPARVRPEPPQVQARFAAPAAQYGTPGSDAWQSDFTSHAQMMARLQALADRPGVRLWNAGTSGQGRALPALLLAEGGRWRPERPTLMLVLLDRWSAPDRAALLRRVNILALPRANPDGAALFKRSTAQGDIDMNRDHLLLRTPEARAMAQLAAGYRPQVVLDMHEFTVGERWVSKFGGWSKYDVLLQAATTGNLNEGIYRAGMQDFLPAIRQAVQAEGLSDFWYHTTSADPKAPVAMGGVQPDTWRNIGGLRNAVSILHETRGIGIGKQHLARRVHSHVVAAEALVARMAERGPQLVALGRAADRAVAAAACHGDIVVAAGQTPERRELVLVDDQTGADKAVAVDWRSSLDLKVTQTRARPCGYWLAPGETRAVDTLRALGVKVESMPGARRWRAERYVFKSIEASQRQDGRGAIQDAEGIVKARSRCSPCRRACPAAAGLSAWRSRWPVWSPPRSSPIRRTASSPRG